MHVALDATPLLGQRTGIGYYTEHLIAGLVDRAAVDPDELTLSATAFTLRGAGALSAVVPPGIATHSLPIPMRLLRAAWSRVEFPPVGLLAGRADVFHGTNYVLPPTGRAGGVVTIPDLAYLTMPDVVNTDSRALRHLVPRSVKRAAVICCISHALADQIRDTYGSGLQVVVTPLGVGQGWLDVRPPDAKLRASLGLPDDYFLFVGTREPRKDLNTLLDAYALYCRDGALSSPERPTLLLVGPDGWGPRQEPMPGVQLRDYAPTASLQAIVAGARALVMPSRDEGFGLPALEGLAAGTPVIVSDVPALLEVTGGQAAVFAVGDVDGLAAALVAASVSGSDSDELAARQRRRGYAAQWTWQRCAEQTVTAYRMAQR